MYWKIFCVSAKRTGRDVEARELVLSLKSGCQSCSDAEAAKTDGCLPRMVVAAFNGGHWIPEMIDIQAVVDPLGRLGKR